MCAQQSNTHLATINVELDALLSIPNHRYRLNAVASEALEGVRT
jgi:recombinational DNA repair protein RecT